MAIRIDRVSAVTPARLLVGAPDALAGLPAAVAAVIGRLAPGLACLRTPVWIVTGDHGTIWWANGAALALWQTDIASLTGYGIADRDVLTALRHSCERGSTSMVRWLEGQRAPHGLTVRVSPVPASGDSDDAPGLAVIEAILAADDAAVQRRERDLTEQATALEATLQTMTQAVSLYDAELKLVSFNRRWVEILKVPPQLAQIGTWFEDIVRHFVRRGDYGPTDNPEVTVARIVARARTVTRLSNQRALWDGTVVEAVVQRMPDGRLMFTFADITELRRSDRELARKSTLLEATLQNVGQGISVVDGDLRLAAWNERFAWMYGFPPDSIQVGRPFIELIRRHLANITPLTGEALEDAARERLAGILAGAEERQEEWMPDGRVIEIRRSPMPDGGFVSTYLDVTERIRASRALGDRELRLNSILSHVADAVVTMDGQGRIEGWNDAAAAMFQWDRDAIVGQMLNRLFPDTAEHQVADLLAVALNRVRDGLGLRRLGQVFPLEWSVAELRLPDSRLYIATMRDVSERKETEERLRQSQKMEAIGQLTGGIAHDFNNLLTVILGNLQWLDEKQGDTHPQRRQLKAAIRAATRGADLTQRLLAFSRRQTLKPEPTRVNELVVSTCEILTRTLGETIQIEQELVADPWPTRIDRNQLEDALINLALNARDAMPDGGKLTIRTRMVHLARGDAPDDHALTGDFVAVEVEDTGTGMTPQVLERAFEPFFTTKDAGRGTGLGLSMVYGFVRQSGGTVQLRSQPGRGTCVGLLLPRSEEEQRHQTPRSRGPVQQGRGETILVVEDDEDVRQIAVMLLEEQGYRVQDFAAPEPALAYLDAGGIVDLLFTDIVLAASMTGARLAHEARARKPGLKVLLTSGYAADVFAAEGDLIRDCDMLGKPYSNLELAERVRAILDGASG